MYFSTESIEVSCSDCKLEINTKRWTKLLMNWLSKCVDPAMEMTGLSSEWLVQAVHKYLDEICYIDADSSVLLNDDLEDFLKYKYPILRLRYFTEEKDEPRKYYIMTSVLLYHCCVNSKSGLIEEDICKYLASHEREMIIKFCESLSEMEITVNNVDTAIETACSAVNDPELKKRKVLTTKTKRPQTPFASNVTSTVTVTATSEAPTQESRKSILAYKSQSTPVTVMSSYLTDSPVSKLSLSSEDDSDNDVRINYDNTTGESTNGMACYLFDNKDKTESQKCGCMAHPSDDLCSNLHDYPGSSRTCDSEIIKICSDDIGKSKELKAGGKKRKAEESKSSVGGKKSKWDDQRRYREPGELSFDSEGYERYEQPSSLDSDWKSAERKVRKGKAEKYYDWNRAGKFVPLSGGDSTDEAERMVDPYSDRYMDGKKGSGERRKKRRDDKKGKEDKYEKIKILCKCKSGLWGLSWLAIFCIAFWLLVLLGSLLGLLLYFSVFRSTPVAYMDHAHGEPLPLPGKVSNQTNTTKIPIKYQGGWTWRCVDNLCIKVFEHEKIKSETYPALSRCILVCTGPTIWPLPIGTTEYNKELVAITTDKMEHKFHTVESKDDLSQYLSEALKLFIGDIAKLERIDVLRRSRRHGELKVNKLHIEVEVESDPDPKFRYNTDETYTIKLDTIDGVVRVNVTGPSFCGVRHGLETLSQLIMIDQSTGHLVTLSHIFIKDGPSFRYRGLMLDTARNYIPLPDILRTIDGMAASKLNTFHWRITDSASFPLLIPTLSNLFEYGAYDRSLVYTKEEVKTVVNRARVRGIRVLMEVALPGPVGRAWSWSDDATCYKKSDNISCDNIVCLRLMMKDSVFDVIEHIYREILEMTGVDDMFHMSDSTFSIAKCHNAAKDREGFLERALERLRAANKGFLPKIPVIWFSRQSFKHSDPKMWERFGVQIYEWPDNSVSLSKFKTIHSSKWDLSCQLEKQRCMRYKTYETCRKQLVGIFPGLGNRCTVGDRGASWSPTPLKGEKPYFGQTWWMEVTLPHRYNMACRTVEKAMARHYFVIAAKLRDSLDFHLWPRAAAVAERLWSDVAINATPTGNTYIRLDAHRWRLLLRGLKVDPVWPVWCSFNPNYCISKLHHWSRGVSGNDDTSTKLYSHHHEPTTEGCRETTKEYCTTRTPTRSTAGNDPHACFGRGSDCFPEVMPVG